MSKLITPTIGRRVWYSPGALDDIGDATPMVQCDPEQPLDAGIVFVHHDRMVNLDVCDHVGNHHARTSVRLLQEDDIPGDDEPHACWMPYQQGQAKAAADVGTTAAAPAASSLEAVPADWKDRVLLEREDLAERLTKLKAFLATPPEGLPPVDETLLRDQANAMDEYLQVLDDRIERFAPAVSSID